MDSYFICAFVYIYVYIYASTITGFHLYIFFKRALLLVFHPHIPSSIPLSYLLTFSCLFNKCNIILTSKAQMLYDDKDKAEHYTNGTSPHIEALTIVYIIELHIPSDAGT